MYRCFTLTPSLRMLLSAATVSVCLIPIQAQTPDPASARVVEMMGQVATSDGLHGYQRALNPGDLVAPQHFIITGPDGFARLEVLTDRSTFEVYPNSRVIFRENRGNWMQLLNVFLGRVKVFIQHKQGGNPNEVSSPTAVISVRGTVFDVEVHDDQTTVVSVDEGLVSVRSTTAYGGGVELKPGESITVIPGQPLVAAQKDKSGFYRGVLRASRDAMWQVLINRRTSVPATLPGNTTQGSNGKPGTGPGSPSGTPGSPGSTPPGPGGGN